MLDSHIHLDFFEDDERTTLVAAAKAAGVTGFVVPAARPRDWDRLARLAAREDDVRVAFGVHPWFAGEIPDLEGTMSELRARLGAERVVAVGECGLDRGRADEVPWARQVSVFEAQLSLAKAIGLPVVVHSVRASSEVLAALRRSGVERAVVHGFSGDRAAATRFLDAGYSLGIGPRAVTNPPTRDALRALPLDRLLVETDAPDTRFRGSERGVPADLLRVVREVAEICAERVEEVRETLSATAEAFWSEPASVVEAPRSSANS